MPDSDVIDSMCASGWSAPYKLISGRAPTVEVTEAMIDSLCRSLRRGRGLPVLDELAQVVTQAMTGYLPSRDALRRLNLIESNHRQDRHARLGVRVAKKMLSDLHQEVATNGGAPKQMIAERFCEALIRNQLLGRAWPELIGVRFADPDEAELYATRLMEAARPKLVKVAAQLAANPTAQGLVKPRNVRGRRPTSELMDIDLEDLGDGD